MYLWIKSLRSNLKLQSLFLFMNLLLFQFAYTRILWKIVSNTTRPSQKELWHLTWWLREEKILQLLSIFPSPLRYIYCQTSYKEVQEFRPSEHSSRDGWTVDNTTNSSAVFGPKKKKKLFNVDLMKFFYRFYARIMKSDTYSKEVVHSHRCKLAHILDAIYRYLHDFTVLKQLWPDLQVLFL